MFYYICCVRRMVGRMVNLGWEGIKSLWRVVLVVLGMDETESLGDWMF